MEHQRHPVGCASPIVDSLAVVDLLDEDDVILMRKEGQKPVIPNPQFVICRSDLAFQESGGVLRRLLKFGNDSASNGFVQLA